MKRQKPIQLKLFDLTFFLITLIILVVQFAETRNESGLYILFFSLSTALLSLFVWYVSSRLMSLWGKIAFIAFVLMRSHYIVLTSIMFRDDYVRIGVNLFLLSLILISAALVFHPAVRSWQGRDKFNEASLFE